MADFIFSAVSSVGYINFSNMSIIFPLIVSVTGGRQPWGM
jgi:hypothetical protein